MLHRINESPCASRSSKAGEKDAQTLAGEAQYEQVIRSELYPHMNPVDGSKTPTRKRKLHEWETPRSSRKIDRVGLFNDQMTRDAYDTTPLNSYSMKLLTTPKSKHRDIPKFPYKVLDAPDLQDDFYLNLVDWGESNVLSVGLASCVYLWAANSSKVTKLCDLASDDDKVTSVTWDKKGKNLAVGMQIRVSKHFLLGTNKGSVKIYDVKTNQCISDYGNHAGRVGALSWCGDALASGSRDRTINTIDPRTAQGVYATIRGHSQEVCFTDL
jgi:cell division cycle 20-like protein 1 (cofactor of APC complex)